MGHILAFEKNFFPRQVVEAGNRWDWALLPLVLAGLVLLGYGGAQMTRPYHVGDALPLARLKGSPRERRIRLCRAARGRPLGGRERQRPWGALS